MLDLRFIRSHPDKVKENLRARQSQANIDGLLAADEKKRALLVQVEEDKALRNKTSKEIGKKKREGQEVGALSQEMKELGQRISQVDQEIKGLDESIQEIMLTIPNMLSPQVPYGGSDEDNVVLEKVGTLPSYDFNPKNHWEIGQDLDIMDADRASKVTGSRFTFMKGAGAKLERALLNFMLDLHEKQGYTEVLAPFMVHERSMVGTGQLPKFKHDMFQIKDTDYYMIPTGEVPLTNLYAQETLEADMMPQYLAGFTPCFRAEAGSAGKDTRGLIRQHQFNKVEMVKFVYPEESEAELDRLIMDAREILDQLGLAYQVVNLCSQDVGFSAQQTVDIEVWMSGYGGYREISSCSNFADFQARRAKIKARKEKKGKATYLHTLNGSGLAIGRTVAALLEHYQQADGSVLIPQVLRPYMGGLEKITSSKELTK